jgi:hypothetical protein
MSFIWQRARHGRGRIQSSPRPDDNSEHRTASTLVDQLLRGAVVNAHISVLENDPSNRDIGLGGRGQLSARLREDNLFLFRSMS